MTLIALRPSPRMVDLVGTLGGEWHGYAAQCHCPAHDDHDPSLSIRQGNRGLLVHCFAGCAPAAILSALDAVAITGGHRAPERGGGRTPGDVERLWEQAGPVDGSLAERYLARRGLRARPPNLRFLTRCPLGPKPRTIFLPALLVAVHEGRRLHAIQRIFLDPATATYRTKRMLGRPGAGAWRGAPPAAVLSLAEGMEDAAAFTQLTGMPCWAALGAGRLQLVAFPADVHEVHLVEDADAEGRRAAAGAADALAAGGIKVVRRPPPSGYRDWAAAVARP
jgi:hypothetical protein